MRHIDIRPFEESCHCFVAIISQYIRRGVDARRNIWEKNCGIEEF